MRDEVSWVRPHRKGQGCRLFLLIQSQCLTPAQHCAGGEGAPENEHAVLHVTRTAKALTPVRLAKAGARSRGARRRLPPESQVPGPNSQARAEEGTLAGEAQQEGSRGSGGSHSQEGEMPSNVGFLFVCL